MATVEFLVNIPTILFNTLIQISLYSAKFWHFDGVYMNFGTG